MDDKVISYAQNREDVILAAFFNENEKGFYVDIGANHPVNDSVTKYFYDRGWNGINIEPNINQYELLEQQRPRDTNLKVGISNKPGKLKLRIYDKGDGLSTFSSEMKTDYKNHKTYFTDEYHDDLVDVVTLEHVLSSSDVRQISFMKVDVEGFEFEVLESNDWESYRPEVLCIEANHVVHDWHPLLQKIGYEKVFNDGLNEYFVSPEASHRKEMFSYVKGLIGRPVIPYKQYEELEVLRQTTIALTEQNQSLVSEINKKENEITRLNVYIYEHTKLRILIRDLLKAVDRSISVRLTEKTRLQKYYPSLGQLDYDKITTKDLYEIIKAADLEAAITPAPAIHRFKRFSAQLILRFYKLLKKGLRVTLRRIKRALKTMVKGN